MRIRRLEVDGVRALGERDLDFGTPAGSAATIVAITGPPASGKSTVLETIIAAKEDVGAYGATLTIEDLVAPGLSAAKVFVSWSLAPSERARFQRVDETIRCETLLGSSITPPPHDEVMVQLLTDYVPESSHAKVEFFPPHRQIPFGSASNMSQRAGDTLDRRVRLTSDNRKYATLIRFIVASGLGLSTRPSGPPPEPGRVTRAFEALCRTKRLGGLYQDGDSALPGFLDAANVAYGLGQLSDSERDALLFAATYVRAGLVQNEPGSVVLIDTPEKHLGDGAADLLRGLLQLGPNNQLIVATNNRAVADVADVVVDLGARS